MAMTMGFWERLLFEKYMQFIHREACFSRQTQLWGYQYKCFKQTCACDPVIVTGIQTNFPTEETTQIFCVFPFPRWAGNFDLGGTLKDKLSSIHFPCAPCSLGTWPSLWPRCPRQHPGQQGVVQLSVKWLSCYADVSGWQVSIPAKG